MLDESKKRINLLLRGTKSFSDILIDLNCEPELISNYKKYFCHSGILRSTKWFLNNNFLFEIIDSVLENHNDYEFFISSHSLGAGIAVLLKILIADQYPDVKLYLFGCPALVSKELLQDFTKNSSNIYHCISDNDIVPYLSKSWITSLKMEVSEKNWKKKFEKEEKKNFFYKKLYDFVTKVTLKKERNQQCDKNERPIEKLYPPGKIVMLKEINEVIYPRFEPKSKNFYKFLHLI